MQLAQQMSSPLHGRYKTGPVLAPWQCARILAFLDISLENKIYVAELARVAKVSPSHFARAFRGSFGQSPIQYILYQRIERSKQKMAVTDIRLSEVALTCGFADQSHFNRVFHRLEGNTPKAWKARLHQHSILHCRKSGVSLVEQREG
jgi:AraC-like DNA-binding protein